jgi:hypothetical protein
VNTYNEVRELGRIPDEKDRSVVCNYIPVALVGSELYTEPSWVTSAVMRARLTTNSRETNGDGARLALLEDVCHTQILERVCGCVGTMGAGTLGMDDSFWDTLTIEM